MSGLFIVYGKPSLYAVALAAWHAVGVGGGCPRSSSGTAKVYYMYIQVQYYLVYFSPLLLADCGRIELLVLFKDTDRDEGGAGRERGDTHTRRTRTGTEQNPHIGTDPHTVQNGGQNPPGSDQKQPPGTTHGPEQTQGPVKSEIAGRATSNQ